jgi:hypothetical protein
MYILYISFVLIVDLKFLFFEGHVFLENLNESPVLKGGPNHSSISTGNFFYKVTF